MKFLLTGSTGFIGSHFVKKLRDINIPCTALVRSSSDVSSLNTLGIDFILDKGCIETLRQDISQSGCTGVIHFASLFLATHTSSQVSPLITSNLEFPTRLLEALSGTSVRWFLNTGTFWQHFERDTYRPVNLYAATKQAFQAILDYYSDSTHLSTMTLKLNDTYGPNDPRKKLIPLLLSNPTSPIELSPGDQQLNLTFIDDVVDAFLHAARLLESDHQQRYKGDSYTVCSTEYYTLKEVVSIIETSLGTSLPISWGAKPYRDREIMSVWTSGTRLPGWNAKTSLEAGLKRIIK